MKLMDMSMKIGSNSYGRLMLFLFVLVFVRCSNNSKITFENWKVACFQSDYAEAWKCINSLCKFDRKFSRSDTTLQDMADITLRSIFHYKSPSEAWQVLQIMNTTAQNCEFGAKIDSLGLLVIGKARNDVGESIALIGKQIKTGHARDLAKDVKRIARKIAELSNFPTSISLMKEARDSLLSVASLLNQQVEFDLDIYNGWVELISCIDNLSKTSQVQFNADSTKKSLDEKYLAFIGQSLRGGLADIIEDPDLKDLEKLEIRAVFFEARVDTVLSFLSSMGVISAQDSITSIKNDFSKTYRKQHAQITNYLSNLRVQMVGTWFRNVSETDQNDYALTGVDSRETEEYILRSDGTFEWESRSRNFVAGLIDRKTLHSKIGKWELKGENLEFKVARILDDGTLDMKNRYGISNTNTGRGWYDCEPRECDYLFPVDALMDDFDKR